ncbi:MULTISPECIES: hypothetical protein [unclassified Streptomyces]|uniref:hypothetical protein n=1 Tax=unclassified Streptomyces TaxID=2593676 RepID=UPI0033A16314
MTGPPTLPPSMPMPMRVRLAENAAQRETPRKAGGTLASNTTDWRGRGPGQGQEL